MYWGTVLQTNLEENFVLTRISQKILYKHTQNMLRYMFYGYGYTYLVLYYTKFNKDNK